MNSEPDKEGKIRTTALVLDPDVVAMEPGLNFISMLRSNAAGVLQRFQRVGLADRIVSSFWDTALDLTLTLV
jgi:hypothetical protein